MKYGHKQRTTNNEHTIGDKIDYFPDIKPTERAGKGRCRRVFAADFFPLYTIGQARL